MQKMLVYLQSYNTTTAPTTAINFRAPENSIQTAKFLEKVFTHQ